MGHPSRDQNGSTDLIACPKHEMFYVLIIIELYANVPLQIAHCETKHDIPIYSYGWRAYNCNPRMNLPFALSCKGQ
jgi:hypothetical protein